MASKYDDLPVFDIDSSGGDWIKGAWDFPEFVTKDGYPPPDDDPGWPAFARSLGKTVAEIRELPVYKVARDMQRRGLPVAPKVK